MFNRMFFKCVRQDLAFYYSSQGKKKKFSPTFFKFVRAWIDVDFRVLFYWRLSMALTVSPRYRFIGLLIFFRLKSRYGVDLSPWAIVDPGVRLMHAFGIVVGPAVQIKCGTTLFHQVTLGMSRPDRETLMMPTIGRFCILGAGSKILGPVEVPDGSLVPANAVVTTKALSKDRECIVECSTTWLSHVKSVLIEIDKESCHAE